MEKVNIIFYNDMGHLMVADFSNIPKHIRDFAYDKIQNKIVYATDAKTLGCRFYILKNGLHDKWVYNYDNIQITLNYSMLDKFDSNRMIYI
jgi:hypothetical protein